MRIFLVCSLLMLPPLAQATPFSLAAERWDYDVSGSIEQGGNQIVLGRDLEVQVRERSSYALRADTGPGLWPDLAAHYTRIQAGGRREVSGTTFLGLIPLQDDITVLAEADVRDWDIVLRYPAALGAGRVWGGLAIKQLSGPVSARSEGSSDTNTRELDETFPLLHGELEYPLAAWLNLEAQGHWIQRGRDLAQEWRLRATLALPGPFAVSAGWQHKRYRLESGADRLDVELDGVLLGLTLSLP